MYVEPRKKTLMMNILDILRTYTDKHHRLSQKQIMSKLERDYNMVVDRKTIRRNITNLMDCGYKIEFDEISRNSPVMELVNAEGKDSNVKKRQQKIDPKTNKPIMESNDIWSNFYLERDFSDGELRLLIDSLLFSRNVPAKQCRELVAKLEKLSNIYFKSRVGYISRMPDENADTENLFSNIELLDEAIGEKKKVSFKYIEYGTNKKKHAKRDAKGKERIYVVSPYQMAVKDGKYYLICNYDKYDDISNYRVDRITDIEILDEKVKPFETLQWSDGKAFDLSKYMKEHIYMYSSENVHVKFRIVRGMVSDIIDIFGMDVWFSEADKEHVMVSVNTNERAMLQFAKNFAPDVEILAPQDLRDKVKSELEKALEVYR